MLANPVAWFVSSLFLLPGVAIAVPTHELGHALVAHWLGDRSPANRGYFRPDDVGKYFTVYGLLMFLFWRVGWGQRIPVNEARLRGTGQQVNYSLGGPAANLIGAVLFGFAFRFLHTGFLFDTTVQPLPLSYLAYILYGIYFANLAMLAFNLLPVPGFDGWIIVEALFRRRNPRFFMDVDFRRLQIQQYLLIGLFLSQLIPAVGGSLLPLAMTPFYEPPALVILGQCSGYVGLVPCLLR
ncbi:MAG: site-2 protease family protein [Candidatus Dormibacteraeota bacterium]|nr:site-2 protease family protein [Candidatus Dormibacteraeota bacterium]